MKKENMASISEVKSTVNALETSPSKTAANSNPVMKKSPAGGKSGASGGSPSFKKPRMS